MKKISLIFAFVLLVVAIFAINVFAAERVLAWDDVDVSASDGSAATYGSLEQLFDKNQDSAGGWYVSNGCAIPGGKTVTIVFKEEFTVTSFDFYGWFNGTRRLVYCYDANNKIVASYDSEYNGIIDGSVTSIDVGEGVKIKKVVLDSNNDQGNARKNQFVELVITADIAECAHDWAPATYDAPKTCKLCGLTEGEKLVCTHTWTPATYEAPKTCTTCGKTEGQPLSSGSSVNIAGEATVTTNNSHWHVVGWGDSTNTAKLYLNDGNPLTGVPSCANSSSNKQTFTFESKRFVEKIVLLCNGYGQLGQIKYIQEQDAVDIGNDYVVTAYNGNEKVFSASINAKGKTELVFDFGDPKYITSVTVEYASGYNWGAAFLREVEIYEKAVAGCVEHTPVKNVTLEPTCTAEGEYSMVCTSCNAVTSTGKIPATGHILGDEYTVAKPATCVSAPVIEYVCTVCGVTSELNNYFEDVTDFIKLDEIITDGAGGWTSSYMAMFDNNMDTKLQASSGWFVQSETNLDKNYYISSVTIWMSNDYNTTGTHGAWMIFYYKAPGSDTWVEAGRMQTPATYADVVYEYTLKLETPVYASAVKVFVGSPTGEFDGQGPGLAHGNGEVYEAKIAGTLVPKTLADHNWGVDTVVAPTCYDYGYTKYVCADCGATKTGVIVPETGIHTCSTIFNEEGNNLCAVCGNTYAANKVTHGEWADASCVAPKTCTVCGVTDGEALPHTWDDATCIAPKTCSVCHATEGDALGHTMSDATCTAPATCSVCGATEGEALGHNVDYWAEETVNVDATCSSTGTMTGICLNCQQEVTVVLPIDSENHADMMVWNDDYTIGICEGCGVVKFSFWSIACEDYGMTADVYASFIDIYSGDEMYSYEFVVVSVVDGVYNITITVAYGEDPFELVNSTATISDEGLTAGAYVFTAAESSEPEYDEFEWCYGTYVTADESIKFIIDAGIVDIYANGDYVGTYTLAYDDVDWSLIAVSEDGETITTWSADEGAWLYGDYMLYPFETEPENPEVPVVDATELDVGNTTIELIGGTVPYIVSVPGSYTLTIGENTVVLLVTGPYTTEEITDTEYTFILNEGDYIRFDIGCPEFGAGTATVTLAKEANIDNSAINGEYYLGADLITFKDGIMTALGAQYEYTYNVDTGRIDTEEGIFFEMIDGTIYFRGNFSQPLHQHVGDAIISVVTDPTCTADGYTTYLCKFCDAVMETVDGEAATGHNYEITEKVEAKPGVAGSITETCTGCGDVKTTEIEALPEHVHTEVKIPAVPSTKDSTGKTSGLVCSECGEITLAPIDAVTGFKLSSALNLAEDISMIYKPLVPSSLDETKAYMIFTFLGKEYTVTDFERDNSVNRNVYKFVEIMPYQMAENVEAVVYAPAADGRESAYKVEFTGVMKYCQNMFASSNDAKLKRLLSDVLVYGAEAQLYTNYKTNNLVTDVCGLELTSSTFTSVPLEYKVNKVDREGKDLTLVDWKSSNLELGNSVRLRLHFEAYGSLEGVSVVVTFDGKSKTYTDLDKLPKNERGRYLLTVEELMVASYNSTIVAKFYDKDGNEIGSTYTHSLYSYIYNSSTVADSAQKLIQSVYNYAESVRAYANLK